MKIGIFGGTFDPVHLGHLFVVTRMKESLGLDKVIVVVANVSPFKVKTPPHADAKSRFEMVKLAFEGMEGIEVSSVEIDRGGVSYTIDTIKFLKQTFKQAEFTLLLSQDAIQSFDTWKNAKEINSSVKVVFAVDENGKKSFDGKHLCPITWTDISSTMIRKKFIEGKECKKFLSAKVLDYITMYQLYSKAYDNG